MSCCRYWITLKGCNMSGRQYSPLLTFQVIHRCIWDPNIVINSLATKRCGANFAPAFFKLILWINIWHISCEIGFRWVPYNAICDKSVLLQVMAWCHQATSHYLSQCWPRFMLPYGITGPQWVNVLADHLVLYGAMPLAFKIEISCRFLSY